MYSLSNPSKLRYGYMLVCRISELWLRIFIMYEKLDRSYWCLKKVNELKRALGSALFAVPSIGDT